MNERSNERMNKYNNKKLIMIKTYNDKNYSNTKNYNKKNIDHPTKSGKYVNNDTQKKIFK